MIQQKIEQAQAKQFIESDLDSEIKSTEEIPLVEDTDENLLDQEGQPTKKNPLRSCVACRKKDSAANMLRFVLDAHQTLWVDIHRKAPGRGANLCFHQSCVNLAIKKKSFSHAFKQNVLHPKAEDLCLQIMTALDRKIYDLIALSAKKRTIISGLNLLESLAQKLKLLICTEDCAISSREQLQKRCSCDTIVFSDSQTLGHLLGKEKRVILGIENQELADQLKLLFKYRSQILAKPSI